MSSRREALTSGEMKKYYLSPKVNEIMFLHTMREHVSHFPLSMYVTHVVPLNSEKKGEKR